MSTGEMCKIITDLGGDPSTLTDKTEKALNSEIIRLLSAKKPTAADVVDAIEDMDEEQVAAVKTALSIQ